MSINRLHNFGAGPSAMPLAVLENIKDGFMEFGGVSILEVYHRSRGFIDLMNETCALIKKLLKVPNNFEVLIMSGGASQQFAIAPMNFLRKKADYAITGHWAEKTFQDASKVGKCAIAYSSKETGFDRTPSRGEIKLSKGADFLHITSNNTAFGTQYKEFPNTGKVPLIADMTSDMFTRKMDFNRLSLAYASSQKNVGTAGSCVVIIRKSLLKKARTDIPSIFSYKAYAEAGSIPCTPPVFSVYVMNLMLKWMKDQGGVLAMEKRCEMKSGLVYSLIDSSSIYSCPALPEHRSAINVVFDLPSKKLEETFVACARECGIVGIAGHRVRGGIRVTLGNAVTPESVIRLIEFMQEFEKMVGM